MSLRSKKYETALEHMRQCKRNLVDAEIKVKQLVADIMKSRTTYRIGDVICSKALPTRPYAIVERITCPNWQDLQDGDVAQLVVRKVRNDGQPSMLTQRLRDPSKYQMYKGELNFDPKDFLNPIFPPSDEDEL